MKKPDTIEEEVNRIRLEIYEEIKDLTTEQYVERTNKIGEALAKQYGFKIVASAKSSKVEDETPMNCMEGGQETAVHERRYFSPV